MAAHILCLARLICKLEWNSYLVEVALCAPAFGQGDEVGGCPNERAIFSDIPYMDKNTMWWSHLERQGRDAYSTLGMNIKDRWGRRTILSSQAILHFLLLGLQLFE
jgi:hypothetical protein